MVRHVGSKAGAGAAAGLGAGSALGAAPGTGTGAGTERALGAAAEPGTGAAAGAERILHAAIGLFGEAGVNGTSLKSIAARAGVSPALILHHYGSKDGLRTACDEWVATTFRTLKAESLGQAPILDPLAVASEHAEHRPMMRYLARTLTDGSPHVTDLLDEMVADAQLLSADAEAAGLMRPSADPAARTALLMIWSLGALVLHEHLERLLGVDLLGSRGHPSRYVRAVMEIHRHGVFTETAGMNEAAEEKENHE